MLQRFLALCCCLIGFTSSNAELPPGTYDQLRIDADEALVLQVTSVKIVTSENYKNVTVQAKVLRVARSKSGLTKGDTVTLKYEVSTIPFPGPRPIPILQKNVIYPAFLKKRGGNFEPAAYGESFNSRSERVSGQ